MSYKQPVEGPAGPVRVYDSFYCVQKASVLQKIISHLK